MSALLEVIETIARFDAEAAREEIRRSTQRLVNLGWPGGSFRKTEMELIALVENFKLKLDQFRRAGTSEGERPE